MTQELEEKLCNLFTEIQPAYSKYCPKERVNFLIVRRALRIKSFVSCLGILENTDIFSYLTVLHAYSMKNSRAI